MSSKLYFLILLATVSSTPAATAEQNAPVLPAQICQHMAQQVSHETGVPVQILLAAALSHNKIETPFWPWTIELQSRRLWFDREAQAKLAIYQSFMNGDRQFKIGCLQLPFHQTGKHFASIERIFDPTENISHAAHALRRSGGNWLEALLAFQRADGAPPQSTTLPAAHQHHTVFPKKMANNQ
ncbi:MAG: hypothetical protein ACSHWZ_00970 [Sulfitobacter sp.]